MTEYADLLDSEENNPFSDPTRRRRKILGIILLILGSYYLLSSIVKLKYYLEAGEIFDPVNGELRSISNYVYLYHVLFLMAVLETISGALFLFNNKYAWMFGMIAVLSRFMTLFFVFSPVMYENMNSTLIIFSIIFGTIYFSLLILLLSRSFRAKYAPTSNTWMLIIGIVLIIFADGMRMFVI